MVDLLQCCNMLESSARSGTWLKSGVSRSAACSYDVGVYVGCGVVLFDQSASFLPARALGQSSAGYAAALVFSIVHEASAIEA